MKGKRKGRREEKREREGEVENHENKSKIFFFFFNEKGKMFKQSKICKVTNGRKRYKIIRW